MRRVTVVLALAVFLAACVESAPQFSAPMTLRGVEVSVAILNTGARVYVLRCRTCHGDDGSGRGPGSAGLVEKPRDFRKADFRYTSTPDGELPTDEDLLATIRNGRVATGMPAFPGLASSEQTAVMQYIKTFSPRWQKPPEPTPP